MATATRQRVITYDELAKLPTKNFEKYLIVSPMNQDSPEEVWTPVPSFIGSVVSKLREKFDQEIKEGDTFVEAPGEVDDARIQRAADEVYAAQQGPAVARILDELSAQELMELMREYLRRMEEPLFSMSDRLAELLQSGEYAQLMMHRSVQLERLIDDVQRFVSVEAQDFDEVIRRLGRLYHDDEGGDGAKGRTEEVQAKNRLRAQVRKELMGMQPARSNTLRFVMRNITYSINYYIYKRVWRLRLKSGISHKEAKGVIQPEVERNALRRFAAQLGPLIIGLPAGLRARMSPEAQEKFKVKTFHDLLTFVNARCWFTFQKKEKMLEPELRCHKGCACGFG
ncbi:hypothetical protein BOX15_Mlig032171g1 [Macrostomum lignano]|uniref:Magnesium transporter n=2 Tax=Macrostomum lignano TaxID=282301 RepID=A0A1I8H466_9PLAT|nr:hypothetical protein BOX15_Mlig032171g1 [Macrostomum lignano]